MTYALGIDLGTTFTAAAVFERGAGSPLDLVGDGTRLEIPTAVHVRGDRSQWQVGLAALAAADADPSLLMTGFKRDVGREQPLLVGGQSITPSELMLAMLEHVLAVVASRRGAAPSHVTLTHPANWGLHRQGELRQIAEAAGLSAAGLLPEPDATAIFHAASRPVPTGSLFAVYDLGGGTFDISLLRKTPDQFELVGPSQGIEELGGLDFDERLWTLVTDRVGDAYVAANDGSEDAVRRSLALEHAVTAAREALSDTDAVDVEVLLPGTSTTVRITRAEFEREVIGLVDRTVEMVAKTCSVSNVAPAGLTAVIMTGGTSRTPLIARRLREELGVAVISEPQPKYSVCLGAAVTAAATIKLAGPVPTLGPEGQPRAVASDVVVPVDIVRSGLSGSHDLALQSVPLTGAIRPIRLRPAVQEAATTATPVTVTTGGAGGAGGGAGAGAGASRSGLLIIGAVAVIVAVVVLLLLMG